jgi:hypothetical protein
MDTPSRRGVTDTPRGGVGKNGPVRRLRRWASSRGGRDDDWVCAQAVTEPEPIHEFVLLALIPTFHEQDVIGATVAHARAQGCDAVYVVDNASPDGTVAAAEAAGATVVESFATSFNDRRERRRRLNEHAARLTKAHGADFTWWLFLDADEFPKGPGGTRIREYLARLDRSYRVVGAQFFNHLPTGAPQYVPGLHPAEFQPSCYARSGHACRAGHFKHQLVRFDRRGPVLRRGHGAHRVAGGVRLVEPPVPIITQHFQYRDEDTTRRRIQLVAGREIDEHGDLLRPNTSVARRLDDLDAVYRADWARVHVDGADELGVTLRPFAELVEPADAAIPRWYPPEKVAAARGTEPVA